jgi:hypothetical protein
MGFIVIFLYLQSALTISHHLSSTPVFPYPFPVPITFRLKECMILSFLWLILLNIMPTGLSILVQINLPEWEENVTFQGIKTHSVPFAVF